MISRLDFRTGHPNSVALMAGPAPAVAAAALLMVMLGACRGMDGREIEGVALGTMSADRILGYARAAFDRQEYDDATELALYVARRFPDSIEMEEAQMLAVDSLRAAGDPVAAFRQSRTLLDARPRSGRRIDLERIIFEIALELLRLEPGWFSDRSYAPEVLNYFVIQYPKSDRADDAYRLLGNFHFEREDYDLALETYRKLWVDYPASEWRELAEIRVGTCYVRLSLGPSYERGFLLRGREVYARYRQRHPDGSFLKEASEQLARVEEMLAAHELEIARLYMVRDQDVGARTHLANAVLAYASSPSAGEAQRLLTDHGWDLSINSLDTLTAEGGSYGDPFDENWAGPLGGYRFSRGQQR